MLPKGLCCHLEAKARKKNHEQECEETHCGGNVQNGVKH